jgi:hypothetical protein
MHLLVFYKDILYTKMLGPFTKMRQVYLNIFGCMPFQKKKKKQILCYLVFTLLIFVLFDTQHFLQHLLNPFVMDFGEVSF